MTRIKYFKAECDLPSSYSFRSRYSSLQSAIDALTPQFDSSLDSFLTPIGREVIATHVFQSDGYLRQVVIRDVSGYLHLFSLTISEYTFCIH